MEHVVVELGQLVQRVVGANLFGMLFDDLLIGRNGVFVAAQLGVDMGFGVEDVVFERMAGKLLQQRVEFGESLVEAVLEDEQLGLGVELQRLGRGVEAEVVHDEDRQVERVVGDELRGRGLEHLALRLRPLEVADVI